MKIQNWSRKKDNQKDDEMVWENDKVDFVLTLRKLEKKGNSRRAEIILEEDDEILSVRNFDKVGNAEEYAKEWMKVNSYAGILKKDAETIRTIGKGGGLEGDMVENFVHFMAIRFPNEYDEDVIEKWARRVNDGVAEAHGDMKTSKALKKADLK